MAVIKAVMATTKVKLKMVMKATKTLAKQAIVTPEAKPVVAILTKITLKKILLTKLTTTPLPATFIRLTSKIT